MNYLQLLYYKIHTKSNNGKVQRVSQNDIIDKVLRIEKILDALREVGGKHC